MMSSSPDSERESSGERRWVTSLEVAQRAGVSRSAVSRCFTPGASIAEATRRRVVEAADALGYRPNAIARSLNTRRSGLVGIVVAEVGNPFYARLVEALAIGIQAQGRAPLVFVAPEAGETDQILSRLLTFQVDGVVVASASLSLRVAELYTAARTPIILVDRMAGDDEQASGDVSADNVAGSAMVAELFAATGRRRPALIAGLDNTSTSVERARGFRTTLAACGLTLFGEDRGGYQYEGGRAAARRLLSGRSRPDAIFCANDEMALGVLDVARSEMGIEVPGELSVAGFDNAAPSALAAYDLTTVDHGIEAMATEAVAMIDAALGGARRPPRARLPCRLLERGTTLRRPGASGAGK